MEAEMGAVGGVEPTAVDASVQVNPDDLEVKSLGLGTYFKVRKRCYENIKIIRI